MGDPLRAAGTGARYALAAVRLFNGAAALAAPRWLQARAGVDPDANPAAVYAWRLFGVRTVYLAGELVVTRGDHLADALRVAPVIHASDALSAAAAGRAGNLPGKSARMATIISTVNFVFAVLAAVTAPRRRARGPRLGRRRR